MYAVPVHHFMILKKLSKFAVSHIDLDLVDRIIVPLENISFGIFLTRCKN